jgi:hypothetical protein
MHYCLVLGQEIRTWGKNRLSTAYFFGFAFTFFMGASQHTGTHAGSHPHGSSMTKTSPHSSHLYFVPFFAIYVHLLTILLHKNLVLPLDIKLFNERFVAPRKTNKAL